MLRTPTIARKKSIRWQRQFRATVGATREVYQDSPLFQDLRNANRLEGKCRQCEYRTICGGSRARAYALTGNPFAEEVDCAYIPPSVDA